MLRRRPTSLVALLIALLTTSSLLQPAQAVAVEDSTPQLVSLQRESGDVVAHGDEVAIAWSFDAPVESVMVTLRDGLGGVQYATAWVGSGGAASGVARIVVDTATWPGGTSVFGGLYYTWTAADGGWRSVQLDATGAVIWKSEGVGAVSPAGDRLGVAPFEVRSDVDLSVPPMLTSATRVSADTLRDGDVAEVAWQADRPLQSVRFRFRDLFGGRHFAEWSAWQSETGSPSTEGVARVPVLTSAWPGGATAFDGVEYTWAGGWISLGADGDVENRSPNGLADATLPGGTDLLSFTVESEVDLSAVPKLLSAQRISPDVVVDGDEVVVRWAFDGPVASVNITVRDAIGRLHVLSSGWSSTPSATGESRAVVEDADWAAGPVQLHELNYTWGWGTGSEWAVLNADGDVVSISDPDADLPSARDAMNVAPFEVRSGVDLTKPASLTSVSRVSADVLADGETLEIAWTADRPLDRIIFRLRDGLGVQHTAWWSMWSGGENVRRTEGVVRVEIDTATWSGGETVFDGVEYGWLGGSMSLDADGDVVFREPSGIADAALPEGGLDDLAFTVDSDIDLAAVPSVISVTRESADVLAGGGELRIAWETDAPVTWMSFQFEDGFGRQQYVWWVGDPSTSGVMTATIDAATWAPGDSELVQVRYSTPTDHTLALARDGSQWSKWPAGIDDAKPYVPGFAALDFELDSDVVFEAVPVPAPTFTDATCDAPAHLKLEDFPHGWWSWGETFGDQLDGEPWGIQVGKPYVVTAIFDDGWGTTGQAQWTFRLTDPGSCEPELELTSAPVPIVTGDPSVGSTLAADAGAWEPAPVELSYQWFRDGLPVPAAEDDRYELTAADAGTTVTVEVTGTKTGYRTTARMSEPVEVQQPSTRDIPAVVHDALDELGPRRLVVRTEPGVIGRMISQAIAASKGAPRSDAEVDVFAASAQYSAEHFAPGVEVVYVASGVGLRAAPTVDALDGPLLLVTPSSIPPVVEAELARLQPKRIVVLDGARGIGRPVVQALEGYLH
ncbi:hypothetical protein [Agromyces mariniharenae]|uniref:Ig-like domain-containing protein n=1 Tax=Agromyces mariniharenae TaxID=2604423 RepID=A0A5S4V3Z1_9MICO|nr:hypothetical protein [Agromyces mariniharenae]TYL53734.1 hypothetical protein FYC51_08810 [Agromyces mariniharenae]